MAKTTTETKTAEKKTTTKKSTAKKVEATKVDETQLALDKAMALIAQMQSEMDELKKQNDAPVIIQNDNSKRRRIKCISLAHHPVNVSTMPNLNGKIFQFVNYGQIVQINYDDLLEVIAAYPNTMASGLVYICDKEVIEDNGLSEAYETIYDKDTMDMIPYLRKEADANLILGMSEDLRESTLIEVVRLYKAGERMDGGALAVLRENGIDIIELAKETVI